ncbi:MAG: EFR1 family ferrodoxin [Defluviitaleaceae bacterium]|nr:EFR1 family ferrodoxin [Defluviitaleaceae bacterium]
MLTLYFSGTGNTKFLAEIFSREMKAECFSVEDDPGNKIAEHDTIAFCYPVYCSRVPRIMREFVQKHMHALRGKKLIIFATQMKFSGDGARVFCDMFEAGAVEVIYAEHFNMQQNMGNTPILNLWHPTEKSARKYAAKTEAKVARCCRDIKNGVVKKRGFSFGSKLLGLIQGKPWQKNTAEIAAQGLEKKMKSDVKIHKNCTSCEICIKICPMKNLQLRDGTVEHLNNCTICYRCVNRCPQKAITVFFHVKPRWQYCGLPKRA